MPIDPRIKNLRPELKEIIKATLQDTTVRDSLVEAILPNKKPKNWGRRSIAPYYKEKFALELKAAIDEMEKDRQPRLYRYEDFPYLSKQSLYLRINQSLLYLLDKLDPDRSYELLRQQIDVTRERDLGGVLLQFSGDFSASGQSSFKPSVVTPLKETPIWKQKVEAFVDSATIGEKLHLEKLMLTEDEVKTLKESFVGIENIWATITSREIKLVKVNPEVL